MQIEQVLFTPLMAAVAVKVWLRYWL